MSGKGGGQDHTHSYLYGAIVEKIVSGEFAAGRHLVEIELASMFEVSRTPVREVLFALQRDGLVERVRNHGARVVSFTADDVEEVYEVRKALECYCVASAVRTVRLNELLALQRRLQALAGTSAKSREKQAEVDMELHRLIVNGSRNRRLIAYMEKLSLLLHSLRLAGYHKFKGDDTLRRTCDEHLAIVEALLRRDVDLCQRLLADHIENGKRDTLEVFFNQVATPA